MQKRSTKKIWKMRSHNARCHKYPYNHQDKHICPAATLSAEEYAIYCRLADARPFYECVQGGDVINVRFSDKKAKMMWQRLWV